MTMTRGGVPSGHLSEEQIDEAMIGGLASEAGGHLNICPMCQERLVTARLPIESFKAVSLAWSERRSATMPVPLQTGLLESLGGHRRLAWGAAVAMLLAVLVTAPLELRHSGRMTVDDAAQMHTTNALGATGVVSGQQSTEEQIERDNQLLNEIDRELNTSGENPAELGLATVRGRTNRHAAVRAVQD
ncbi:hypothetical protein GOB94_13080 [Granulicella sp. 5B5]|uniref:hypothetical protein n=1 Tax=Granulicella sp. 5B5 TaxID=1617967 RepID=UPI0015F4DA6E|nr:hypothetical protein [Granulicella sp. 5B5]QMV19515.1 hypothetical protein GOB94_13080 [Granulicella sp. 5B5]